MYVYVYIYIYIYISFKKCLHSRVPGGFSRDPMRCLSGRFQLCAPSKLLLFTVLELCHPSKTQAKRSVAQGFTEKHDTFGTFSLQSWPWPPGSQFPPFSRWGPRWPRPRSGQKKIKLTLFRLEKKTSKSEARHSKMESQSHPKLMQKTWKNEV